jgi:sugar/nucleoside kinase (ribokinase family)
MEPRSIDYIFLGGLRTDYCITHNGQARLGVMGGNAIYAATGAKVWSSSVGIVSRVGSNYPKEWILSLEDAGIDTRGIRILEDPHDTLTFYAYISEEERVDINPAAHFLRIGHPLPKELLDYQS